ncbi:MAG: hypothetical protein A4E69_00240 [Syntrophus sp. PtaB.Bin138]|nr:MAG: hypothetical protein A4E69_00240 [Syntrophus sp. PtaB.Bin138]
MRANMTSAFENMKRLQLVIPFVLLFVIARPVLPGYSQTMESNMDRPGMNLKNFNLPSPDPKICQDACKQETACRAWTYVKPGVQSQAARCLLKSGVPTAVPNTCCVSGVASSQVISPIQMQAMPIQTAQTPQMQQPAGIGSKVGEMETNIDRPGMNFKNFDLPLADPKLCKSYCQMDSACKAWTYVNPGIQAQAARCWLKSGVPAAVPNACCVSGLALSEIRKVVPIQNQAMPIQTAQVPKRQQPAGTDSQEAEEDARAAARLSPAERQRIDQASATRRARMEQFQKTFAPQVKVKLADYRLQLAKVQAQSREKEITSFRAKIKQVPSVPSGALPAAKVLSQTEFALRLKQASQQQVTVKPSGIQPPASGFQKPVTIKTVMNGGSNTNADTMEESSPALIYGENFGADPGGALLEYDVCRASGQDTFQPGACPKIAKVPLLPGMSNWQQSWYDSAIGVRLPAIPELQQTLKATLVVVAKGGATARHDVQYLPTGYPSLTNVSAAPFVPFSSGGLAVVSGGEVLVEGSGFGSNGQIWIDVSTPVSGMTKIFLQPGEGTWQSSWNDRKIHASVPKIPGDYAIQAGKLRVRNGLTGKIGTWELGFSPNYVMTITSGMEYLEVDTGGRSGEDYAEESNGIIHVIHKTTCGWWIFSSGNKGVDWFFRTPPGAGKKSLSPNCKVVQPTIVKVDPDETGKIIDFLIDQIKSLIEDVLKENMNALYKRFAERVFYAIAGAIDSGVGKYGVWEEKAPSAKDSSVGIRWHNTCATISPLKGVPVEYTGVFLIYGPEGVCPGTTN